MLSEKGSLKDTPVLKLLITIFEQGLTGILYVKRVDVLKVVYFSRGKIIWAISNSEVDKLENILLNKNLTDAATIRRVKSESSVSESIGKALVEKGMITLEELIESSREQLRKIIISIMKWKDGGFQFIKDSPPERLLSLDLSVTDFVIDFILEEVDISDIWKEIGSLQLELIRTPDVEKLAKYNLSDTQNQLLNSFDGENKLESILSRHSGGHRESLLKIIYFFMMAELLIKKEFELSDAAIFNTEPEESPAEPDFAGPDTDSPFETYNPSDIVKSSAESQIFPQDKKITAEYEPPLAADDVVAAKATTERQRKKKDIERPTLGYGDEQAAVTTAKPFVTFDPPNEKKRRKMLNTALVLVFLVLVFGGIILLLVPWLENDPPLIAGKNGKKDIISIEEPGHNLGIKDLPAGDNAKAADGNTETGKTDEKTDDKTTKTVPPKTDTKNIKINPKQIKIDKTKPPKTEPVKEKPGPQKKAISYFRTRDFITAGKVWKKELIAAKIKYTIMLELDCQKESVINAYRLMKRHKDFFIINRAANRRTCFLVMWGKFRTEAEATKAVKDVPNYFWKQSDPPEIVPLAKYFK